MAAFIEYTRDTVIRRVTDAPVVGHPLRLRVRVPRYRSRALRVIEKCSPTIPFSLPAEDGPRPGGAPATSCVG